MRDLGAMIGFIPRILPGCLGWQVAIQPGPTLHTSVDRLPPLLWCTSALCPVLILPASSAEAIARGSTIRVPPAIRMPSLPAWEQAVALIVRRNQQARRHRRDYPHPAGAPSRAASLSAALHLAQTLGDVARAVSGKDPMRRETRSLKREAPSSAVLRPAAAAASADGGSHTACCAENPIRRERDAAPKPDPRVSDLLSAARATSASAAAIAGGLEDPIRREIVGAGQPLCTASAAAVGDAMSLAPDASLAWRHAPTSGRASGSAHRQNHMRRVAGTMARTEPLRPVSARQAVSGSAATAVPQNAKDPMHRERTTASKPEPCASNLP
ncbi:MAG TPA: hypothetical protein VN702_00070, partial [Acetobacteraceae bacterium]|nr:hypothetical protein [Acetobacteraceae bacterium]